MVNRVFLLGTLSDDPTLATTPAGRECRMRLITTTSWRDASGTLREAEEAHIVVAYQRLAEICAMQCAAGTVVHVDGRLRTRLVDDSGVLRPVTEVVVANARFVANRRPKPSVTGDQATPAA